MTSEWITKYLENFQKGIPKGTDYEKEFQPIVFAIIKKLKDKFPEGRINKIGVN